MLNLDGLEKDLYDCFHDTIPGAFEQAFLATFPQPTKQGKKLAKDFGENIDAMLSEDWAKRISSAIDYYIKTGCIHGTLLATGPSISPVYTCNVSPVNLGNPIAGSVPNTLGIQ